MRAAVVSGARVEKVSEGRRDKPANWRAGESTSEQSFGARHVAVFLVKILPGIKNTNLRLRALRTHERQTVLAVSLLALLLP